MYLYKRIKNYKIYLNTFCLSLYNLTDNDITVIFRINKLCLFSLSMPCRGLASYKIPMWICAPVIETLCHHLTVKLLSNASMCDSPVVPLCCQYSAKLIVAFISIRHMTHQTFYQTSCSLLSTTLSASRLCCMS